MFLILQKYTTDPELTPLLQLQIRAHARLYTSLLKQAQLNNRSVAFEYGLSVLIDSILQLTEISIIR